MIAPIRADVKPCHPFWHLATPYRRTPFDLLIYRNISNEIAAVGTTVVTVLAGMLSGELKSLPDSTQCVLAISSRDRLACSASAKGVDINTRS
jgi:hypothetical protein